MANSGAEKLMAVALASGIMVKAISSSVCEVNCDIERITCATGLAWVEHRDSGGRQREGREHQERHQHAAEQHFADRVGLRQVFRRGAGKRKDRARADHQKDRERDVLLAPGRCGRRRVGAARCGAHNAGRLWLFLGVTVLGWTDGYHARASTGSRNVEEPPSGVHGRSAPRAHHVPASPDSTPF